MVYHPLCHSNRQRTEIDIKFSGHTFSKIHFSWATLIIDCWWLQHPENPSCRPDSLSATKMALEVRWRMDSFDAGIYAFHTTQTGWWFGTFGWLFRISIGSRIISSDELKLFFRGVAQPPTGRKMVILWDDLWPWAYHMKHTMYVLWNQTRISRESEKFRPYRVCTD